MALVIISQVAVLLCGHSELLPAAHFLCVLPAFRVVPDPGYHPGPSPASHRPSCCFESKTPDLIIYRTWRWHDACLHSWWSPRLASGINRRQSRRPTPRTVARWIDSMGICQVWVAIWRLLHHQPWNQNQRHLNAGDVS